MADIVTVCDICICTLGSQPASKICVNLWFGLGVGF